MKDDLPHSDPERPRDEATVRAGAPVVFYHGGGGAEASASWIEALRRAGLQLYSHRPAEGVTGTHSRLRELGPLCEEIARAAPDRPLLIVRAGLAVPEALLDRVAAHLAESDKADAITALSNAVPDLNPYASLPGTDGLEPKAATELVARLSSRRLHRVEPWHGHFLALTATAVRSLAQPAVTPDNAIARLRHNGGDLWLADDLFVVDPSIPLDRAAPMEAHEEPRPVAWGGLTERLGAWLRAPASLPPRRHTTSSTLHITHSWGGGVAAWVEAFIAADTAGHHLQLRSEGPRSGAGAGQRLALYEGAATSPPVASWWLQPPIQAVETDNGQYREVLEEILRCYPIARVVVSSLVGHSLDALRMERPTVQVLHDHFPAWPLLSIHPSEYGGDLAAAMEDPRAGERFEHVSVEQWGAIAAAYAEATDRVRLAAPSRSVIDIQRTLGHGWESRDIGFIPHGLPPLEGAAAVEPRPRADGRLRLVIPGRVQSGKGSALLDAAIDRLTPLAQVYLLGAGKGGERYFGRGGVNVVTKYRREDLPTLLAAIGPDCAALLSIVPETFSYTLSEMRALAVPTIATRLGAFVERIRDGRDGWLIEPTADALVDRVEALADDPAALKPVREILAAERPRAMPEMLRDYETLCPPATVRAGPVSKGQTLAEAQAGSWRDLALRSRLAADRAERSVESLEAEVNRRTEWALDEQHRREAEQKRRERWVAQLSEEISDLRGQLGAGQAKIDALHSELDQRARHIETLDQELDQELAARRALEARYNALRDAHEQVLASRSWRLTRPLRVSRRVTHNFLRARAWNPLRWPLLLSQLVRNLSTLGVGGTLHRMQQAGRTETPERTVIEAAAATAEGVELPDAVPSSDAPRVSIVIPAYNHLDHTAACLASLGRAACEAPFEVIVVDDASADASAERLPEVAGLRYLRNEENRGFILSCNRGAEAAIGEFVLFLNNDTEVQDGWLDALLSVFEGRDDAGLVGARLVYPDGTLQECGGLVFRDGSGWNYGRGDDPDRPEYLFLRETDYCSGACIVLRRELFESLGGFDTHYAPAYYEDTDLAFRVREAGLRVYVQPAATVVHHEGVSSGTDLESGTKRYQNVNREKFLERWADALRNQPPPIEDPEDRAAVRAARDHRLRGRVLIIDAYTPEPDQDSGSVRLTHLMNCLQRMGRGVSFFPDNHAYAGRYTRALQRAGVEAWYDPWLGSSHDFLARHGREFTHVVVSRHYIAANYLSPVRKFAPGARFIFDTVDLHYLREQRLAELEGKPALAQAARQTRRSELGVIRAADATLVVSAVEQEELSRAAPDARVRVLSNIHEVPGCQRGFDERRDLFFVGGFQHPPNIDAVRWFVSEIWPRVRESLPEARFHVVGSKAPDEVRDLAAARTDEGVVFHGYVEDLEPFLDGCRFSVAPLRYGAGVKGKVNQSMSRGQPVVATSAAVEGLHAVDGRDVLVADDAEGFAAATVRLYRDQALWETISQHAVENVRRYFSVDAARRDLEALFADLGDAGDDG